MKSIIELETIRLCQNSIEERRKKIEQLEKEIKEFEDDIDYTRKKFANR